VSTGAPVVGEIVVPGFGDVNADLDVAGIDSGGTATIIASVIGPVASGTSNPFAGPGTHNFLSSWPSWYLLIQLVVTILADPDGVGSEAKFQLADGTNVDNKCSFDDTKAECTAVLVKASVTSTMTFESAFPTGFTGFDDLPATATGAPLSAPSGSQASHPSPSGTSSSAQGAPSGTSSSAQGAPSKSPSSASKLGFTTGSALMAVGVFIGMLL
jgi:hypothetical protein